MGMTTFRNDTERQLWLDIYKAARVENFEPWVMMAIADAKATGNAPDAADRMSKAARAADFAVAELREREPEAWLPVDPRTGGEPR